MVDALNAMINNNGIINSNLLTQQICRVLANKTLLIG